MGAYLRPLWYCADKSGLQDNEFKGVPFGQRYKDKSLSNKELMKMVLEGSITHDDNLAFNG